MNLSLYEAVLYTDDVPATAAFYEHTLGLRVVKEPTTLMAVLRPSGDPGPVILIFNRTEAAQPGREVPSHGAHGAGHLALRMTSGEYEAWKSRLASKNIATEREVRWETGARSLYFRDPAGNSVELVENEIWPL